MGVPLAGDYDVLLNRPIDSRTTWTGNFENLNTIAANGANRYPGLITYVTGDKNLYVFQGGAPGTWEKIVTTNVDSVTFNTSFDIIPDHHGQVLYVNSSSPVQASIIGSLLDPVFPEGFNVTIVQEGTGSITFGNSPPPGGGIDSWLLYNRANFRTTAGQYAIASILRIRNSRIFTLYGDLI